jgi:hypothetical protein
MNIKMISARLQKEGFKVDRGEVAGFKIDLIASKKITTVNPYVYFVFAPNLDEDTADLWQERLGAIAKKEEGLLSIKVVSICFVVDNVSSSTAESLLRVKKGDWPRFYIVDREIGKFHGNLPLMPVPRKFASELKNIMVDLLMFDE